ncbi:MAG: hypothetical protein GX625_05960 [Clostridiaceae bacterium]|nr:hypothetical protein [Clostridiaceae bacterium]
MKKILVTLTLVLLLATSIISGTLAMYTTKIDALAEGSVVAKEFILTEGGTDTFAQNVKLSPGESEEWKFSVKNYNGAVISETAMSLEFNVILSAADGKEVIAPLAISVKNSDGEVLGTAAGSGTIAFNDEFDLDENGQEKSYTVSVSWPSNNGVDIDYAGAGFGNAVKVSVTGMQK